jgi:hypothetical protein
VTAFRFCVVAVLVGVTVPTHAQAPAVAPAFEVVSMRRNISGAGRGSASLPESGQWRFAHP